MRTGDLMWVCDTVHLQIQPAWLRICMREARMLAWEIERHQHGHGAPIQHILPP
jgi:hypothetical protein